MTKVSKSDEEWSKSDEVFKRNMAKRGFWVTLVEYLRITRIPLLRDPGITKIPPPAGITLPRVLLLLQERTTLPRVLLFSWEEDYPAQSTPSSRGRTTLPSVLLLLHMLTSGHGG